MKILTTLIAVFAALTFFVSSAGFASSDTDQMDLDNFGSAHDFVIDNANDDSLANGVLNHVNDTTQTIDLDEKVVDFDSSYLISTDGTNSPIESTADVDLTNNFNTMASSIATGNAVGVSTNASVVTDLDNSIANSSSIGNIVNDPF